LTKEVIMRNLLASSGMAVCLVLALATGCSDKNSLEACQYATTMDLDKGNYDAVLQSSCASEMQLGAAHFGKAGFDIKNVINGFIDANAANNAVKSDLDIYMNSLVFKVSSQTLTDLDLARASYGAVLTGAEGFKDAQFYLSLVDAVKTLSLIKTVISSSGTGTMSLCDINSNTHSDEADATACSLLVSGTTLTGGACPAPLATSVTYTTTPTDIFFTSLTGTYKGFVATMAGAPAGSCTGVYKKLLYQKPGGTYYTATTSGTCLASDGQQWPCPLTSYIDLVATLQTSINDSVDTLNTAITGTSSSDVVQAIKTIQTDACGSDGICTSAELANYFLFLTL
jgi:hypothetical protein